MRRTLLLAGLLAAIPVRMFAGGAVSINWANDGNGTIGRLYSDFAGTTLLSGGADATAGDGFRIDLVAIQGATNYVLATASVGDAPGAVGSPAAGYFDLTSTVSSNVLAGAVGAPLGVRFFNATTSAAVTMVGVISNTTITVPTPNWAVPPFPISFAPDPTDSNYQGPRTAGNTGFYTDTATGNIFTNHAPVAICHDVVASAGANCSASVSASQVNNGSSDPDGDPLSFALDPVGPYVVGTNSVTLTVADNHGGTNTCQANVIVIDNTPPSIVCPPDVLFQAAADQTSAVVFFSAPNASDNCGLQSVVAEPPSGSVFPLGITPVLCTAVDAAGLTTTCSFNLTVSPPPPTAAEQIVSLQGDVTSLRQCLGEAGLLLLAHNHAGAVAQLTTCAATGSLLVSNAQSQVTSTALGAKTATKLAKKIAAWVKKLSVAVPVDDTKALKTLLKLTSTGIKVEQLFQRLGNFYPYLVVTEVKGKTGYHGTNEVVCYHVNVFDGAGLTNCGPVQITITNFPDSAGLDVVTGPTSYTNLVDFCITTGHATGGALITATACNQSNSVVLINTGD